MNSCEQEPQLKIRAAAPAAEAWTMLKFNYEGKRRTHLSHLFYSITRSKFDDRKTTIKAHIESFEKGWLSLAQAVATATPSATIPDGAIVHFTKSDTWKAYTLINSFPRIQPYINIIDNITSKEDTVTYANTVIRLKEISERPVRQQGRTDSEEPTTAFATEDRPRRFCGYCEKAGCSGTSHNEADCKWKKRDANKASTSAYVTESVMTTTNDDDPAWKEYIAFISTTETQRDINSSDWYIDSCATVHITNDKNDLINIILHRDGVRTGAGMIHSTHHGTAQVNGMQLTNVLLISSFPKKLINIGDITAAGGTLTLSHGNDVLRYQGIEHKLIKVGKLWKLPMAEVYMADTEWHERYGHIPYPSFALISEAPVHLRSIQHQCEACIVAKSIKPASPQQFNIRTSRVGELIHSDLCGPMPVEGIGR